MATRDCGAARRFYELALEPLGFSVVFDWPQGRRAHLGLGSEASSLWLVEDADPGRVALSFAAPDRSAVDAFYASALAAGAVPLSPPAPRPEHTPSTYAAAVADPDGNTIEAVCWRAEAIAGPAASAA